ncbi:MAG: aminodeoxychorismate synthase component [Bacteroidetes bacterium]|nr:aminodeoxychorismate synthase component [Bacteroidota bacterium]
MNKLAETTIFPLADEASFKLRALRWAAQFQTVCLLDSNSYALDKYSTVEWMLAVDALDFCMDKTNSFEALKVFTANASDKIFGYLSYDLKNQVEHLTSENPDGIGFPLMYFFKPRYIIEVKEGKVTFNRNYPEAFDLYERIMTTDDGRGTTANAFIPLSLTPRTPRDKYISSVNSIKQQITSGDFYEMNYCCEFYAENTKIKPLSVFEKLNESAKAPFTSFFKLGEKYLLCASPERFLKKTGNKIISQPIKGTIKRGATPEEDQLLKDQLLHSVKERAENVMIVDLVRNDLARSARTDTVRVDELFGIYEFPTVHQMISTVTAEAMDDIHPVDIICNAFPMGSMTGAPKVEVMKNIEAFEDQKRGLYSGAVGYFTPDGDFDLNVVIRSIFYNATSQYLSIQVGGAITYDADSEAEYEEMLLKAKGMLAALNTKIK